LFSLALLAVNYNNVLSEGPATPQTLCCYTTLWNYVTRAWSNRLDCQA